MSRDYKPRKGSANKMSGVSLIWGILIGYILGLITAIGIWLYLSQAPSPFLTEERVNSAPLIRFDNADEQIETPKKQVNETEVAKADEKPKFDFYNILPGSDEPNAVTKPVIERPPEVKVKEDTAAIIETSSERYFLQAGSFRSIDEAENLKARLALLGMVAMVQSASVPDKGVWYRVRIGPLTKMAEVDRMRLDLSQNGIVASLIKLNN